MVVKVPREYPAEFLSQASFAAGEVGPDLWGRVDQEFYYIGARTVRNWIVRQYGGVSNRMGLRHVAEARYHNKEFRLIKFQFNEEQTYVIEMGDQYMRIIADGGQVIEGNKPVEGVSAASTGVVTSTAHGLSDGDDVYLSGISGMIQLNGRSFRVDNATTDTFELNDYQGNPIDTSAYFAYTSGGNINRIYTVVTPWSHDDVFELGFTQSNDVLTIVHPDYYPRDITRTGNTAWTVSLFNNKGGPFADENIDVAKTVMVNAGVSTNITNAVDNGSGLIRLTVTSTAGLTNGDVVTVTGVQGIPALAGSTTWTVTVINGTTLDLQGSTFSGSYSQVKTVSNAGNSAGLIRLTLNNTTNLVTGNTVTVAGVGGVPAANGTWIITVINATQIDLQGSSFAGAYTSGGSVTLQNGGNLSNSPSDAGVIVTLTASTNTFDANMVGDLFYIEQEPNDTTPMWEAAKAITLPNTSRAGTNYYKALNAATTGTIKPDHVEGTQTDGNAGVTWEYLHSGFAILELTSYVSPTEMKARTIGKVPANVVGKPTSIWAKSAWSEEEGYPSAAVYHKGRCIFAATPKQPSLLWMSKAKVRNDFSESNPILDDEAITLSMNATEMNAIRHLLPLQDLITLTSATEFLIKGDADGALLATNPPNPIIQGYTGSSIVPPIVIGNTALMVQDMGSSVHTIKYQFDSDSFGGIDMTARSPHLFRNKYIKDWAYQRQPFSTVWACMDDGCLNGFTFMEEQRVYAWHRHDSDNAKFLTTSAIREGRETSAYFGVERVVNGQTRKYIEVFASRYFNGIEEAFFVDSGVTYDGRNKSTNTITVSGGSSWASEDAEDLTLTCTAPIFTALDATTRNQIVFLTTHTDGTTIRLAFEITAFTSSTVVTAIAKRDVPLAYQGVARTDWNFAKRRFFGLDHIEGKKISCLSEGNVVPNLTVTDGEVTIPDAGYIVHLGLGYVCDLETLSLAGPQGSTKGKVISVPAAHITVQETKSLNVGNNGFDKVKRAPARGVETGYDPSIPASTGLVDVVLNTSFSRQGRICIREDQPVPVTVNAITLELEAGDNG